MGSKSILRFGPYEDPGDYSGWPRGVLQLRSAWEKEAEIAESGEDRGSHCVGSDRSALLELRVRTLEKEVRNSMGWPYQSQYCPEDNWR